MTSAAARAAAAGGGGSTPDGNGGMVTTTGVAPASATATASAWATRGDRPVSVRTTTVSPALTAAPVSTTRRAPGSNAENGGAAVDPSALSVGAGSDPMPTIDRTSLV